MQLITFFTLINALVASGAPGVERRDRTITITSTITQTITIYVTARQDPTTVVAVPTQDPIPTNDPLTPVNDSSSLASWPTKEPSANDPPTNDPPNASSPVVDPSTGQPTAGQSLTNQPTDLQPSSTKPSETTAPVGPPSANEPPAAQPSGGDTPVSEDPNDYIPVVLPGSNPPLVIYLPRPAETTTDQPATSGPSVVQPEETTTSKEAPATTPATLTKLSSQTATFTQISTAPVETTVVTPEVSVTTISKTSGAVQILPTASTRTPKSEGTVMTSLHATGAPTAAPVISTTISKPETTISTSEVSSVSSTVVTDAPSVNVFVPIATDAPHGAIPRRDDHPVPRLGINQKSPIETNKFYGNFFLGSQTDPTWTHPYSISWAKGQGSSWGMAISHVDRNQASFGPDGSNPAQYFVNPAGIQSIVLSASELGSSTVLTTDSLTAFSANVNLAASEGQLPAITFPVVQGMGFVTGIYNGGTPVINSGVLFRTLTKVDKRVKTGVTKYRIVLEDGKEWLLYASSADKLDLDLQVVNNAMIQATSNFNGFIQIAKNPGNGEDYFDAACGTYAEGVELFGSVSGDAGSYTFKFRKAGIADSDLLMFALPHHVESFSGVTAASITSLKLVTTTKGTATGVVADYWTMTEQLPTDMRFAPWSPETGSIDTLSEEAIQEIKDIAASEVSEDMDTQTNSDSMYFGGKALAKFAGIVYTLSELLDEKALGQAGLKQLKAAFNRFVNNQQQNPLVYESAWGGVVSTAAYVSGDSLADFGNTYYNDHHFHYGYHIYTAAVIAHLDPSVLQDGDFTSYVTTLLRDISNPSSQDPYFPVQRAFDYFNGHSWAKGLFSSVDGKDQESTSEDMMHAYAIKAWGLATGDANIIARGNLQLAVTARTVKNYFLYESDNTIEPAQIIGNKVSGILFENKIDHTTYFGTNIEYIQGIHMLPLLPCTSLSRSPRFVQEEWDTYFSNGRADTINSGWRGILYGNLIRTQPSAAWDFFVGKNGWSADWIDGGASRTWYLAFAAAMRDGPQASRSTQSRVMFVSSLNQTSTASNQTSTENYKRNETPFRGSLWSRIHLHKLHGH